MNIIAFATAAVLLLANPFEDPDTIPVISIVGNQLEQVPEIALFNREGWFYHSGDDPALASDSAFSGSWTPASLAMWPGHVPDDWDGIGWFAGLVRIDSSLHNREVALWGRIYGAMEVYVDGELAGSAGRVGTDYKTEETIGLFEPISFSFGEKDLQFIAIRYSNHNYRKLWDKAPIGPLLRMGLPATVLHQFQSRIEETRINRQISFLLMGVLLAFAFLHFILFFYYPPEKANLVYSLLLLSYFVLSYANVSIGLTMDPDLFLRHLYLEGIAVSLAGAINISFVFVVTRRKLNWIPAAFAIAGLVLIISVFQNPVETRSFLVLFTYISTVAAIVFFLKDRIQNDRKDFNVIIATYIIYFSLIIPRTLLLSTEISILWAEIQIITQVATLFIPIGYSFFLAKNFSSINRQLKDQLEKNERLAAEKQKLVENKKEELEREVLARTAELGKSNQLLIDSLGKLTAAQDQLIQQEKLASLGQLTAGIAHEIKNPLNFVNNFSDVSLEMIDEALEELQQIGENKHAAEAAAILADIKSNLAKIHEHGSRADGIVKSMLMHSRGGDGKMEPTPLNPIIKEYVNLAFHGMRASKEPIDVDIDLQLDESVGDVPLIAEDFSRVILNLCNNAFDAMRSLGAERSAHGESYNPKLTVSTKSENGQILIEVQDNGPGIPDDIKDKIMQPFFTTKKGTQGTGLGLSITHDIVKAHGGELHISSATEGSCFKILINN